VVTEIRAEGARAIAVRADIGDPAQVAGMVDRIGAEFGPVSVLVNNAGVALRASLETSIPRAWNGCDVRTSMD
jgi:3-oxoacyl-[acyl-carrier protein] reductase